MDKWLYNPNNYNFNWFAEGQNNPWRSAPGGGGVEVPPPDASDNVFLTAESGNSSVGIYVNNNRLEVNSLDCTGFEGNLYDQVGLGFSIFGSLTLGSTASLQTTIIYFRGTNINCSGNSLNATLKIISVDNGNICTTIDLKNTGRVELIVGELITNSLLNVYGLEASQFHTYSLSSEPKSFLTPNSGNLNWNITGSGEVWNVLTNNTSCGTTGKVLFSANTSSPRYIDHSPVVIGEPEYMRVGGTGSGGIVFGIYGTTELFNIEFVGALTGSVVELRNLLLLGDLNFGNSFINWNNSGSNPIQFGQLPTYGPYIYLSPNMTITNSGNFIIPNNTEVYFPSNPGAKSLVGSINISTGGKLIAEDVFLSTGSFTMNGGTFTSFIQTTITGNVFVGSSATFDSPGPCTITGTVSLTSGLIDVNSCIINGNTSISGGQFNAYINLRVNGTMTMTGGGLDTQWGDPSLNIITGTFTLTAGGVISENLSIGTFSSSNSNPRSFSVITLFFTGTGTLMSISAANQTNLAFDVADITVRANDSLSRSLTLNNAVCAYGYVTLEGNGSGATTMTFNVNSNVYSWVRVTKQNGSLSLGTSTMRSLTFFEGSTILWSSTSTIRILEEELRLCNSMSVGSTPGTISFPIENEYDANIYTANKTFTGTLSIGKYNSTTINGDYISTSTSTSAILVATVGYVQFLGNIQIAGSFSISSGFSGGSGSYYGNANVVGSTTANRITISDSVVLLGSVTVNLDISFSTWGDLSFRPNSIVNIGTVFTSSSSSAERQINLNNAIINLNGTGTIWNTSSGVSTGVLGVNGINATVNINNTSSALCTLALGGIPIGNVNINRSNNIPSSTTLTTFTGLGNTHGNFRDFTILPPTSVHQITFAASSIGTSTYIYDTFQVGNSINRTNLISSSVSNRFYLQKLNPGSAICPNVLVQLSIVSGANFYAISGSTDGGGNAGWIFNTPPRRLGSLGAG